MIDSLITNLFVILVYLIPGSIITYAIYMKKPHFLSLGMDRNQSDKLNKYAVIAISLFLGVILHALIQIPSFLPESIAAKKIRTEWKEFTELYKGKDGIVYRKLKNSADTQGVYASLKREYDPIENDADYFIAEKLVKEKAVREHDDVYRLEAFYYLCRNGSIPVAIFIIVFFTNRPHRKRRWIYLTATLLCAEFTILITAFHYFAAKICAVLAILAVLE